MLFYVRQKVVVKRKKVEAETPAGAKKKAKSVVFQSVISATKFSEVGGNEKSLKVTKSSRPRLKLFF